MKIEIFDTTLRDGLQGAGVSFNHDDKINIIRALDSLGISYIEAGMITDDASFDFFKSLGDVKTKNAKLCAFTSTVHPGMKTGDSTALKRCAAAPVGCAVIYGKSWLYQVSDVLHTTPEENLRMIRDSVKYLKESGKEVIFDAEHFFDGYGDHADYAMRVIEAAREAGACKVVLCDTNGGMLPDVIGMITERVCKDFSNVGIHCHNDMGTAVAGSVSAVLAGASHVQGTISGVGERCGNTNINTIIPLLQLKLGFDCVGDGISNLTPCVKYINETANLTFNETEPFVGAYAFTHKAGSHIDGVKKNPKSFEHINPEAVGNLRNIVISELSGRAAVIEKIEALTPCDEFKKDSPEVLEAAKLIREKENAGYAYENAEGSLALLIDEILGKRENHFSLLEFKVIVEDTRREIADGDALKSSAIIKIAVDETEEITAAEGNGPVNAMDCALRRALTRFYPHVNKMKLADYKVRVIDSSATASKVRVLIESTDGVSVWRTVGVSTDIINASWQALRDSVEYMLSHVCRGESEINK